MKKLMVLFAVIAVVLAGCVVQYSEEDAAPFAVVEEDYSAEEVPVEEEIEEPEFIPEEPEINYNTSPVERNFKWDFKGKPKDESDKERVHRMTLTLYEGLNDYLNSTPPLAYTEEDYYLQYVNNEKQHYIIKQIVDEFKTYGYNDDETARLLVAFVAQIPYVHGEYQKYPYELLFTQGGVCSDKALLSAALLKELGYATALLLFEEENHMALGVKCSPLRVNVMYGEYCFTEVSNLYSRIGRQPDDYEGIDEITSTPEIIVVSDGLVYGQNKDWTLSS